MQLDFLPTDVDAFASLPAKWRSQADEWRKALERLFNSQMTKAEVCASLGVNRATVDRKIAAVKEYGWRGLIPNYKAPTRLPEAFVEAWKALQQKYQRKTSSAYRELLRMWRAKEKIEGYDGHPGWPNLPAGWDKRNLYRYQPTKLELTALRHGLGRAIHLHAPKTLATRVGLWPLSHILWDDVQLDMKAHVLTSRQECRPMQIGALDLLSGCRFHHGNKPQLKRKDGTKASLNEADMRFALAAELYTFGISSRGTTMVIEHGTAAIRDRVRDILKRGLGDKIHFDDSGMTGKLQAIAGMGDGKGGGGNFRFKAALESLHNLIHNDLSALPAQIGHDRDEPEFLGTVERELQLLWRLAKRLPTETLQLFKFPTHEYHSQLVPLINGLLETINRREDHDLEGWAALGFITREYRLTADSPVWMPEAQLLALPSTAQAAMRAVADADQRCWRPRKLSPREVFDAGMQSGTIERVPTGIIAEILYQDLAQPRKCMDGTFSFRDIEIAPEEMHFESRIMRADGREEELKDRETYEVVLNPFDPSKLWVFAGTRSRGAFLGIAKRVERVCRADRPAAERAWGRQKERLTDLLEGSRNRNVRRTKDAAARHKHNADTIEAFKAKRADFTRQATDALTASLPASPDHSSPSTPSPYDPRTLI